MSDDSATPISLETADGETLEAEVHLPVGAPAGVAITHPHPTYGGSMHTPVPAALFGRAASLGLAALRFNFRGVGRSTGTHDEGLAERLDVSAALDHLGEQVGGRPLVLAGWSFGADVAMAVDHTMLAGWLMVAAPLSVVDPGEMIAPTSTKPTWLLVPEHDQFRSPAAAQEATNEWINTRVEVVPGTDHFLAGGLGVVADGLERFVAEIR